MSHSIEGLNIKCSQCHLKPSAVICLECQPDKGESNARFCYSCFNLTHDERNVQHKKQTLSFSNLRESFSPRKVPFNEENLRGGLTRSKFLSSSKASPFKKEKVQSNLVSTPLNQHSASNYLYTQQSSITDSIDKKIRESRKKEVISKLNDLNNKMGVTPLNQSQQSLFQNRYKEYLSNARSPLSSSKIPTRDGAEPFFSYSSSNVKFTESFHPERLDKFRGEGSFFSKKIQHVSLISTPNPQFDSKIEEPPKKQDAENLKKLEEEKKRLKDQLEEIKRSIAEEAKRFEETESAKRQLIDEEASQFLQLNEEIKKSTEDYDKQVQALALNLRTIKEEYENKLQEFEKLLKTSTGTIEKLQSAIVTAQKKEKDQPKNVKNQEEMAIEMKKELAKKKEILEKFKQGVSLSTEKCQEVSQTLEKILNSKQKIVDELANDNAEKEEDIKKLHQIVENFKQMFEELNVQEKARDIIMEALEKAKANGGEGNNEKDEEEEQDQDPEEK